MNKQDIDKAASALVGAKNYFAPVVTALNQADEVFSVLSNAIKLKDAIETDIDALQGTLSSMKSEVAESIALIAANKNTASEAKAQIDIDIANAKMQGDNEIKSIKESVDERIKKVVAVADARIAEFNSAVQEAKDSYDKEVAVIAANKSSLQSDVDALETKLATLRDQAKKFAASLVE